MKILIINGPNLNLLGKREPEIYGNESFEEYLELLRNFFPFHNIEYIQTNIEGELINALQDAENHYDHIVLNAGGYTHTSVAIADAVKAIVTPVVEVHITNLFAREDYRHTSLIAPWCKGTISGFGLDSYRLAILSLS
jgi:3-dehydroquinate dehydratase II